MKKEGRSLLGLDLLIGYDFNPKLEKLLVIVISWLDHDPPNSLDQN